MTRSVILHVGTVKTGSTSIQNVLDARRDDLLARGVWFPQSVFTRKVSGQPERTSGHLQLLRDLSAGDISAFDEERRSVTYDRLLLSAENIFHFEDETTLALLRSEILQGPVTLVVMLRPQLRWLASFYAEMVQGGWDRETRSFDAFALDVLASGKLDYAAGLDRMVRLFEPDKVVVLDYDAVRRSERGVLGTFIDQTDLDIPTDQEAQSKRSNVTQYDPAGLEAHRRLNVLAGAFWNADMHAWTQAVLAMIAQSAGAGQASAPPQLSRNVRRKLSVAVEGFNQTLSRQYLGGTPFGTQPQSETEMETAIAVDDARVDDFVMRGLQLFAECRDRAKSLKAKPNHLVPPTMFAAHELQFLYRKLQGAGRVMGYAAGTMCAITALRPGCVAVFAEPDHDRALALQSHFDRLGLPSSPNIWHVSTTRQLWTLPGMQAPDLVLTPVSQLGSCLAECREFAQGPTSVVAYPDPSSDKTDPMQSAPPADETVGALCVYNLRHLGTSQAASVV